MLHKFFAENDKIAFEDFKTFMYRFKSYFNEQDLEMFLEEVEILEQADGLIDIIEIAAMVRNDIEMFPK